MNLVKRMLTIVCSLLLVFSLTAAQATDVAGSEPARFSLGDMAVSDVYVNATKEEATAVLGPPLSGEIVTLGATGEQQEIWYYDGLTLTFSSEDKLISAEVSAEMYAGPRRVAVGNTSQDVISRFYSDLHSSSDNVLYTDGYVDLLDAQLPPCGFTQHNEDGSFSISYAAPESPFSDDVLADPMDYVYENLALFTVTFDQSGIATAYSWYLGPWAE